MSHSIVSRAALSALRTASTGSKPASAVSQAVSARPLYMERSHDARYFHGSPGNAFSRTPFSVPALPTLPASDRNSSTAQGSAISYNSKIDQADFGSPPRALDWTDSTHGMDEPFGSHTPFARTAGGAGSSKATTPSNLGVHGSNLDPICTSFPGSDQLPPSSTNDSSKPPQPSITISSVGSNGSIKSGQLKLYGERVFADLFKIGRGEKSK